MLPLPKGEGRGEGEPDALLPKGPRQIPRLSKIVWWVRSSEPAAFARQQEQPEDQQRTAGRFGHGGHGLRRNRLETGVFILGLRFQDHCAAYRRDELIARRQLRRLGEVARGTKA